MMAVYIDNFNAPFRGMTMCHMIADTQKELLAMVKKIGVNAKWIQSFGTTTEHFDICLSKKKLALKYGAKEITFMELGRMIYSRTYEGIKPIKLFKNEKRNRGKLPSRKTLRKRR